MNIFKKKKKYDNILKKVDDFDNESIKKLIDEIEYEYLKEIRKEKINSIKDE